MLLRCADTAELVSAAGKLVSECADRAMEQDRELWQLQVILRELAERAGAAPVAAPSMAQSKHV